VEGEIVVAAKGEVMVAAEGEAMVAAEVESVAAMVAMEGEPDDGKSDVDHGVITSTCVVCICPSVCNKCGVCGGSAIFQCLGCKLPVPRDMRRCHVCGNEILSYKFWCKDCATKVALDKEGYCLICGRNSNKVEKEDEDSVVFVPDTLEN
jgi:hypothetical protein